ncbi:putative Aflatoxin biosynthesis ketoreductase nor-1 [Glarea lozoyensis 74030]|uniref:Putative Aflatoxin biosynthesis ketoreductase nor-1 n=1 Tax=Glarea lozoyensis (strain ATCC 74030 / MF5533) TaxID=1104152 RepID=H0ENA9_GLAL7|nr:putative Aflatoxin biosynthesis ketoreductase nor-1 [Glarea lozoyensis 74030]
MAVELPIKMIVSVRNPQDSSSLSLRDLPAGPSSSLIIIPIDFNVNESVAAGIAELKSKHNITSLDVVIANAAIGTTFPKVIDAKVEDMIPHYQVNVVGVVALFQAVFPYLEKAKEPKFFPNAVYGTTKAAVHFITKHIHQEHDNIIAFPIDPGWVQTDMGNGGAVIYGLEKADIDVNTSVTGLTKVLDREADIRKLPVFKDEEAVAAGDGGEFGTGARVRVGVPVAEDVGVRFEDDDAGADGFGEAGSAFGSSAAATAAASISALSSKIMEGKITSKDNEHCPRNSMENEASDRRDNATSEGHWRVPSNDLKRRRAHDVLNIERGVEEKDSKRPVSEKEGDHESWHVRYFEDGGWKKRMLGNPTLNRA